MQEGVKERVKSVLNYKKPTLWIMIATAAVLVILAVCFLMNPAKEYKIRITIPAGSTEPFCYSDEEISPKGNTLTFYAGEGLGDTEITLLPVEVRRENAYDEPVYITPGMPVKIDVEKGAWFKIGVNIQNPTDENKDVYISVRNVEVRIASSDEARDSSPVTISREEYISLQAEEMPLENGTIQNIMLYEQPEADRVCIKVQPSMIRENAYYYYIPTDKDQEWLSAQVQALDLEGGTV